MDKEMGKYYIVNISAPRFLTTETELVIGAKGILDLMRVIIQYSRKYCEFKIRVN